MSEPISVRDSLVQASAELAEPEVTPVAAASEAVVELAPEPIAPEPEAEAAPVAADGRDEKGRFASKDSKAPELVAEEKPQTAAPADEGAQTEPTRIPQSLSPAVKAQWTDLPPEVRKDFSRLEETVQTAKAEWGAKGQRLNRFDEIIGPHIDHWRLNGLDEFSGVQTLLAAQTILERNPVQGLVHIARSYGVHPSQIAEALGLPPSPQTATEGQSAPTGQPDLTAALQPYLQRVQALEQQHAASRQAAETAELDRLTAEVLTFMDDPANLYVHNVEKDMELLLRAKAATGIKDAYEKAIWASPEIRPLLLKAQSADAAKVTADAAARQKAATARHASGSVTGSPSPGAQATGQGSKGSVREDLRAAMQEIGAQV